MTTEEVTQESQVFIPGRPPPTCGPGTTGATDAGDDQY